MARTKAGLIFCKTIDGSQPAMRWYPVVGGTAYHEGQIVRLSGTSGSAKRAAAAGTAILGVLGAGVSSGSAATVNLPVYLADTKNAFKATMVATSSSKKRMNDLVDIRFGTDTVHDYKLSGTGSAEQCRIIGYDPANTDGAANNTYIVTFNPAKSLFGTSHTAS